MKRTILGVLLVLGMILGMSFVASAATTHTTLNEGDIIKEGDIIEFTNSIYFQAKTTDGSYNGNQFSSGERFQLIRATTNNKEIYTFKSMPSTRRDISDALWTTEKSDGLIVKKIEASVGPSNSFCITLEVHEHEHNYDTAWSSDSTNHWHACKGDGNTAACLEEAGAAKAAHSYGTSGDARFTCIVCGYVNSTKKAEAEAADKAAADKAAREAEEAAKKPAEEPITISKTPASVKAKAKKNKVTVTWKKIKKTKKTKALLAQIKSVQVQYSTDPTFTQNTVTKTVGKNKTKVVLKLQKKTQYYIRVRYVGSDGVSRWSKAKRVKTK